MVDPKGYRIAVLRGGPSSERGISLLSGEAVLESLRRNFPCVYDLVVPDSDDVEFLKGWIREGLEARKIQICFIALHGWFGEDGTLQEYLEEIGYPYTGSGPEASRLAMDKVSSRKIFQDNGIPIPRYKVVKGLDDLREGLDGLSFPVVVKPSSQGSSVGVSKVEGQEDLEEAIREAICYDGKAIIEEFIDGYELTVGILDDKPLPVIRIKPSLEFYSYKAKYTQGLTEYLIPADVDNRIQTRAQELAIQAHKLLGCRCFSRVDMLYSLKDDEIYVLEVNTIPGLTKTSLLPKAAKAVGIDFDQLVKIMLNSALDKVKCLRR